MDDSGTIARIIDEVAEGEVVFPTHINVALRVRLALEDPQLHLASAAQAVQAEPLLATRVVAVANSFAFNRTGQAIVDVKRAISLLGVKLVRSLATALIMRQMASASDNDEQRRLATRLWEHTAHVAALAHVLTSRLGRCDADSALFAGMVHEVGTFYLISRTNAYPPLLDMLRAWEDACATRFESGGAAWLQTAEAQIGEAVMRALGVPETVVEAVGVLWQGAPPEHGGTRLGDVLTLAHGLTPITSPFTLSASAANVDTERTTDPWLASVLLDSADELVSLNAALCI